MEADNARDWVVRACMTPVLGGKRHVRENAWSVDKDEGGGGMGAGVGEGEGGKTGKVVMEWSVGVSVGGVGERWHRRGYRCGQGRWRQGRGQSWTLRKVWQERGRDRCVGVVKEKANAVCGHGQGRNMAGRRKALAIAETDGA
jgi:hypothetical protein